VINSFKNLSAAESRRIWMSRSYPLTKYRTTLQMEFEGQLPIIVSRYLSTGGYVSIQEIDSDSHLSHSNHDCGGNSMA
jgi:hypothetical protein